ncbi:nucleotidyl transferase AbiEii/AbiGii toxin family protein [Trueperella pyogenes]|uniref:nucleotidyl transferase AbiEii/AbiGii toxin family protein n=1 Tax=Trueperella pyogenes TaxID=1661 RepID=UPI00345E0530
MAWREAHRQVQDQFLSYLGEHSDLVLKGGTALMKCYGLDRFSEDLDFDALRPKVSTVRLVQRFCQARGYQASVKKNTDTVQRVMIRYNQDHSLKVETSYRTRNINPEDVTVVDGIRVYSLDALAQLKAAAYLGRDTIRDLYDVTFLVNHHLDDVSQGTRSLLRVALANKGLDQFDVVLSENNDDLIDSDQLATNLLEAYEHLGIQSMAEERALAHTGLSEWGLTHAMRQTSVRPAGSSSSLLDDNTVGPSVGKTKNKRGRTR